MQLNLSLMLGCKMSMMFQPFDMSFGFFSMIVCITIHLFGHLLVILKVFVQFIESLFLTQSFFSMHGSFIRIRILFILKVLVQVISIGVNVLFVIISISFHFLIMVRSQLLQSLSFDSVLNSFLHVMLGSFSMLLMSFVVVL